jgi:hypothetical protein
MRVGNRAGGFIQAYLWRMALPLYLVDAFTARPFAGKGIGIRDRNFDFRRQWG